MKTANGKSAQKIAEYVRYIEQLGGGKAGRLQAVQGESIGTVRRRLGAAARQLKRNLTIRRTGDEIYFWAEEGVLLFDEADALFGKRTATRQAKQAKARTTKRR